MNHLRYLILRDDFLHQRDASTFLEVTTAPKEFVSNQSLFHLWASVLFYRFFNFRNKDLDFVCAVEVISISSHRSKDSNASWCKLQINDGAFCATLTDKIRASVQWLRGATHNYCCPESGFRTTTQYPTAIPIVVCFSCSHDEIYRWHVQII